jgi:hypothetical protein
LDHLPTVRHDKYKSGLTNLLVYVQKQIKGLQYAKVELETIALWLLPKLERALPPDMTVRFRRTLPGNSTDEKVTKSYKQKMELLIAHIRK